MDHTCCSECGCSKVSSRTDITAAKTVRTSRQRLRRIRRLVDHALDRLNPGLCLLYASVERITVIGISILPVGVPTQDQHNCRHGHDAAQGKDQQNQGKFSHSAAVGRVWRPTGPEEVQQGRQPTPALQTWTCCACRMKTAHCEPAQASRPPEPRGDRGIPDHGHRQPLGRSTAPIRGLGRAGRNLSVYRPKSAASRVTLTDGETLENLQKSKIGHCSAMDLSERKGKVRSFSGHLEKSLKFRLWAA